MSSGRIRAARKKLDERTGPHSMEDFPQKVEAAREYAQAILSAEDKRYFRPIALIRLLSADEHFRKGRTSWQSARLWLSEDNSAALQD